MAHIDFAERRVTLKLASHGRFTSGWGSGGRIWFVRLYEHLPRAQKGELRIEVMQGDQHASFEYRPPRLPGAPQQFEYVFHLLGYNPNSYFKATRKLALEGADGVLFVVNADPSWQEGNAEMAADLAEFVPAEVPRVLAWTNRGQPDAVPRERLEAFNATGAPWVPVDDPEMLVVAVRTLGDLAIAQFARTYG